ncbi:hypothetical protein BDY24DRAFT_391410 [Mrakia frigida]|uniref:Pex28p n=1 Tax=Mrakia frigida TaxID=29902 RepID=UPI003FCBF2B0
MSSFVEMSSLSSSSLSSLLSSLTVTPNMTIHPSHPIPLAAKPVFVSSSGLSQDPASTTPNSQPRPFPSSSDGPFLAIRAASSSTTPAPPPPPTTAPTALPQSYTTQLSDLLLSAVVPGIPKTKGKGGAGAGASKLVDSEGRRLLTSKKEELNLTTTTQNFRKFVLKIGWLFTLQDHIEQLIFWHRPSHSVLFLISWTILSFKPHLLLLLPPLILLAFLLAPYNLPPLKVSLPTLRATLVWEDEDEGSGAGSDEEAGRRERTSSPSRKGSVGLGRSFSISGTSGDRGGAGGKAEGPTSAQTHALIEERKAEANLSSVYYQNIQGIQNLMGMFADGYDSLASPLTTFFSPTHPLHQTFIAASLVSLLLLSFFASSIPPYAVLLPVGWGPLLVGLIPPTTPLPLVPPPSLTSLLSKLHLLILNDRIPPNLLSLPRRTVSIYESQRFSTPSSSAKESSGWGEPSWGGREVGSSLPGGAGEAGAVVHGLNELVLEPKEEWEWLKGEEWYVDRGGEWVDGGAVGVDAEGWSYLNSHHQPSATPYTSSIPVGPTGEDVEVGTVRRRRWWRRGVKVA